MRRRSEGQRVPRRRRRAAAPLLLAAALAGCVSEPEEGATVVLPPQAFRYERFIESSTSLSADRILVEAVTAYRKDFAPVVNEDYHTKEITQDRIRLTNLDARFTRHPVRLAFRNMQLAARERIEVVFSDLPLLQGQADPPILVIVAEGLARFAGDGVDAAGDRVVLRNHEVKAFLADGRAVPVEDRWQ